MGEILNVSTGTPLAITGLAKIIMELAGKTVPIEYITKRAGDPHYVVGSYAKLNRLTGWEPTTELRTGLLETIKWMES